MTGNLAGEIIIGPQATAQETVDRLLEAVPRSRTVQGAREHDAAGGEPAYLVDRLDRSP